MDVLSDILRTVRVSGSVLFRAEFSAPWSLYAPHSREFAWMFQPHAKRMVLFHIVAEGTCWAEAEHCPPVELSTGDVVVLPYGDSVVMGDQSGRKAEPVLALLPPLPWSKLPLLRYGGDGGITDILCGFLHVDEVSLHPLLAGMPRMFRIRTNETFPRLQAIIRYTLDEARSDRPGGACMLNRLAEILYVEILRQYMEDPPGDALEPLSSIKDPLVGRALSLIHGDPGRNWTVDALAREVGASRSILAERFTASVRHPPMTYLGRWRIQLAANRLRETQDSIAAIAELVGYQSEPAFNKAFKRHVGQPPASWRRQNCAV